MEIAVEMKGITKVYPDGTVALRGVDFCAYVGEIHALLGENGAGKTTLMRILYGEIKPTTGVIKVFGKEVRFRSPRDALRHGIAMVYQHFSLIPTMTVLENLYLAYTSIYGSTKMSVVEKRAKELCRLLGIELPMDVRVESLPIGVQQRIEIVKALLLGAKVLILDEPTSVLTPMETEKLFEMLRRLKEHGATVIFITHKLREVKMVADRVTVLRRGRVAGVARVSDVSEADLARMMVGREVIFEVSSRRPASRGRPVLVVEDLWVKDDRGLDAVKGVSFELYEGEILGIAGVQGNGQKELAEALAGIRMPHRGRIILNGVDITHLPTSKRYKMGLAYIPDSRAVGLVLEMSVAENAILTNVESYSRRLLLEMRKVMSFARKVVERYNVVTPSLRTTVKYLSGGNQQKLMIGREIEKNPSVFVVCEPTHGLDVAATEYVRRLLLKLRDRGRAVLLISSDLDEILQLSDRIAVIYEGRILALKPRESYTIEEIGLLMGGVAGG